ncbi:protein ANTAGONIST OF LIKE HETEROCHROMATIN PROTEIN 1-like [Solenopsis invicta]|uniref:protein ANTAGONIST OF LIKE HETEROCHROMATIN PROTEIN 1-like n=1 Tax=Solenopsis invicta TaxID=13686 RepID=UPI00193D9FA2|nr:protein ANTAGONIST OF LIKE HETEROCHROMATIN PROTEIN 1-like [Solenopsis invicta]
MNEMDEVDAIIATVIHRRKITLTLFLVIERLRRQRNQHRRRLWSRQWLQRRETHNSVLTMLFEEFGPEDPRSFQNFTRMQEEVMEELLNLLIPYIEKKNTVMREAISPRMRLSATLRYLATGNSFQDLAYSTRIAPNTLSQIISETLQAIIIVLDKKVIPFPSKPEEWKIVANRFETMWQFPHCVGAVDGKHILFRPPRSDGSKYRNYKGKDSIILLAVVDANYKFIFVDVGKNGSSHDSVVFRESLLGVKLKENTLNLPPPKTLLNFNFKMPYVIVGDDAFSLHTNLMKPYPDRSLTENRRIFNYRLSRARRIVENAFGILANRFRVLLNPIPLSVEKVETTTYACVLLHNFLLSKNVQRYIPSEYRSENSKTPESGLRSVNQQRGNRSSVVAREIRNMFTEYFNTTGAVPWQYSAIEKGN